MSIATIQHLFLKPSHGLPMEGRSHLILQKSYGIDGDINANPYSPRQVLVVRQEDLNHFKISPGRLRENIVIRGSNPQDFSPGTVLQFEQGATIRLTFYCEPCKHVAQWIPSLKQIEQKRGILGIVSNSGPMSVQESVTLQPQALIPLSDIPYERFLYFVNHIPKGKVATYRQILTGIGVSRSYFRVLPLYIRKAIKTACPVHRVVTSQGCLVDHIPNQQGLLTTEGIEVDPNHNHSFSVCLSIYGWDGLVF